mmetsp:Transcript_8725/g.27451  ORF Transcript_8725/g.27451 Transcript_8725/m.27451 type:complete len:348 (-) Transcript_8725:1014-2057(-)
MPGTAASALYMIASLLRSSADVASSRIASLGLLTSTRAKASRCCSPNESSSPQSRTASSPSTPRSAKRSSCTVARASSKLPSVPRLLPLAHSSTVLGYTSCWRSEPSVQYGRCGRNIVSAVCGREMSPEPRSHSPATARSIDDLPVPELPIRRRWRPGCTSTDTFEKRRREPSGVESESWRTANTPPPGTSPPSALRTPPRVGATTPSSSGSPCLLRGGGGGAPLRPYKTLSQTEGASPPSAAVCAAASAFGPLRPNRSACQREGVPPPASAEAAASASRKVAGEEEFEEGPWYASMRSTKVARRPRPAEKEERPSNWLTMMERSPRTWLKAPVDWVITPSSTEPAK